MYNTKIRKNTFETKKDVENGFLDLLEPLTPFYSEENPGHLNLGSHGTVYTEPTREAEAFLRPLWGIGPYLVSNDSDFAEKYLAGIIAGTDPASESYWGGIKDFDQLIVEMAALSTSLMLNKEKLWERLSTVQQNNLHQWLMQANEHTIPRNNWHFFRVLVNLAMKKCGMPYSKSRMEEDLAIADSFYVGKGWYYDGVETQADYYVSFAIHYYSLLYCHFMADEDPKRVKVMKERATAFAQTFRYWFDSTGEAIPFGRSLTYRFAQVSFFSALVFADVEALPWGEIKGLISRHMHSWVNQDIFTKEGLLSVGYHYQNLVFAEGYNGPGSPYWAFKTFILLAVPDDHPYWQAKAEPLADREDTLSLPESRNFYQYNEDRSHLQIFPAGQYVNFQSHAGAKYSKFVYSSRFGFSVPKSTRWYYEGAFDSCLALAEDDQYFRSKELDTAYEILPDRIVHYWEPWPDVSVRSTIIPLKNCHVRIHEIDTQRELDACDGGFSVPFEGELPLAQGMTATAVSGAGISQIEGVAGFSEADIIKTEPNTNLFFPLTILPYVKAHLSKGRHLLVSLASGTLPEEGAKRPEITIKRDEIIILQGAKRVHAALER